MENCLRDAGVPNGRQDRSVNTQGRIETFKPSVGLLDFADNSADTAGFAASLRSFVTRLRGQMKGSMPVPLHIKGYSKPSETSPASIAADRASAVQAILTTADDSPNPIKVVAASSGQSSRVEFWPDLDYEWSFKRGEKTYDYNVGAHEFGHLLGLPDEYGERRGSGQRCKSDGQNEFPQALRRCQCSSADFPLAYAKHDVRMA